jgi:hypothetical protein
VTRPPFAGRTLLTAREVVQQARLDGNHEANDKHVTVALKRLGYVPSGKQRVSNKAGIRIWSLSGSGPQGPPEGLRRGDQEEAEDMSDGTKWLAYEIESLGISNIHKSWADKVRVGVYLSPAQWRAVVTRLRSLEAAERRVNKPRVIHWVKSTPRGPKHQRD